MTVACIWFPRSTPVSSVAEHFLRFSPQIAVVGEKAILIEIGKCRRLFSQDSFIARVQVILKRLSLEARLRLGTSIPDAVCKAKYDVGDSALLPLGALVDLMDPFHTDETTRKSVIKLIDCFSDLGVRTIGDFRRIPVGSLIERFGILGRLAYQRALFEDVVPWPYWSPKEVIFERKDFSVFEFYGDLEPILFELKTQLDQIFSRLYARQNKAMSLQIEMRCERFSTVRKPIRVMDFHFFAPQSSTKGTLKIIKERLNRELERSPLTSPVQSLKTTVTKMVPASYGQRNMLDNQEEIFESVNSIHNQLIELLGKDRVFQVELTEDRRPEKSWKKSLREPHVAPDTEPDVVNLLPQRATYQFRQPVKIDITAGFVHIRKKRYRILHWDNNLEKISGGWEENPSANLQKAFDRNYYNVIIEGHHKLFVFESPTREYYLHGYYG